MLLSISLGVSVASAQKPYLSSLSANSNFPLYTTYAAAMQRSNFILDEGYHFQYYLKDQGADFVTDTGGDIALGFLMNGKWVYKVSDMYRPVTIKASYPDLLIYELFPFKNVKVEVSFFVYSSTNALMNIHIFNTGKTKISLSIIPFMRKTQSPFREIQFRSNGFVFHHEEYPDGWTTSHNLPYTDCITNFFSMSVKADDYFSFNSEAGEPFKYPFINFLNEKSVLQFHGRAYLPGKERLGNADQTLRIQLFPGDNDKRLITENIPVPGSTSSSMTKDAYYTLEAGLLGENSTYRIMAFDEKNFVGYSAELASDLIKKQRNDIHLTRVDFPAAPKNVSVKDSSGTITVSWNRSKEALFYDVYKRTQPQLYFEKIAANLKKNSLSYNKTNAGDVSSFIVIAKNEKGNRSIHSEEVFNIPKTVFANYLQRTSIKKNSYAPFGKIIGLRKNVSLASGASLKFSIQRSVAAGTSNSDSLIRLSNKLLTKEHKPYLEDNEKMYKKVPMPVWQNKQEEALYWSANNMMRQVFYPPEGKSTYNYYVFSREPTWGWGHGGQVFHESIAMLAYAYIDPVSAMNSQRVYRERQYANGYINYRTGSYLDEIIEHNNQLTSSAPWYAWLNWEVYLITKDKSFLKEMYESSKRFYRFIVENRDSDKDGLCEWGGEAILESVRDALVAVWDQVGYPTHFESLDLNCMLVNEAKSLEKMANELNLTTEAFTWKEDYIKRSALINKTFWDDENGFYYNVNKTDHSFTFKKPNDLKRDEIIGFLPLWSGIATPDQATRLIATLTDTSAFWRKYGIPSLSAKDTYYNPKGYWNGPVWVEWNYLVLRGLLDYGFNTEAGELVDKVSRGMIEVLKQNHNLWEFYSPDEPWGGYHKTYIWAGIINRMMMDVDKIKRKESNEKLMKEEEVIKKNKKIVHEPIFIFNNSFNNFC